ncbi:ABC transporter permease [Bacteroidota bacterium]
MIKNYLKIAVRNLLRQKSYSFINIFGLAIGLACSILILLWVLDELSYDNHNQNVNNIYRVVEEQLYAGGEIFPVAVTPNPLGPALQETFAEISKATRLRSRRATVKYENDIFNEIIHFTDPEFFDVFSVEIVSGDLSTAMANPDNLIITEQMAEKYFGADDPIGKLLNLNNQNDFIITAVIKRFPDNSHFIPDFIIPWKFYENMLSGFGVDIDNWGSNSIYTYILLDGKTDYLEVEKKISGFIGEKDEGTTTTLQLQPLGKIHLFSGSKYAADIGGHGDIIYVRIFMAIAIFILVIACINFMNLSTARSERRSREVGLRKVTGAKRYQIISQFIGESVLLSFIALNFAIIIVKLLLPAFNTLSGKDLTVNYFDINVLLGFLLITIFTGLLAGSYPALYLSSFNPVNVLKGVKRKAKGSIYFRRILVIVQFTLSIILIIGTLTVSRQLYHINNINLGLNKENILYTGFPGRDRLKFESFKEELLKYPDILRITNTEAHPASNYNSTSGWDWDGKETEDKVLMHVDGVGYDYLETFNIKLAEGRFFSNEYGTDSLSVIVNERAVELMRMENPIGQILKSGEVNLNIIGVMKNFHFKSIHNEIEPLVIRFTESPGLIFYKINSENTERTVKQIEKIYKEFDGDRGSFNLRFLDEDYDNLYRSEHRMARIFTYFAILAILISCLGLYGMSSFIAEQRTREIGIRKVVGSSVSNIIILLSKEFTRLVLLSNIVAWPIAWFIMNKWLQNFAYQTKIYWWIFILAGSIALIIAFMTVAIQTIKTATRNPADSLRYE